MRAAKFQGAGIPLSIEQVPDPEPGPTDAIIKVARCGICGSDIHMTSGHAMDYAPGTILGHEYSGEVVAVGKDVTSLKVGDRIAAMPATGCGHCAACLSGQPMSCFQWEGRIGGFGEYLRAAAASAVKLPEALSFADGALVEPLAVSLNGVQLAGMTPGARVLVIGAGAVGLAAIYWARLMGAGRIAAASPSRRREALALQMGADAFETLGEGESERIAAALGGMPEIVLECAGAVGVLQKSIELAGPRARIVSLGFCTQPDPILPSLATWKQVSLGFGFSWSLDQFRHAVDTLDRGHVEPRLMISDTVSLDALPAAFEAIRAGASQTKVQVSPWQA